MATTKVPEVKELVSTNLEKGVPALPSAELVVDSSKVGSRVSLNVDFGDFAVSLDMPMGSFAARYLEEKGIINP